MALQTETPLDHTDWQILRALQQDARLSFNEIGRRVGLSAPAAAEGNIAAPLRGLIGRIIHIEPSMPG